MKKYAIIALSAMTAMTANCHLYFKNGVEWKTEILGIPDGHLRKSIETVTLEGDTTVDGFKAVKMYVQADSENHDSRKELAAAIRTEGEKVYFFHDSETPEWLLMYDFGLKPGEGSYVHYLPTGSNKIPFRSYMKCMSLGKDEDSGWDTMTLEEYETDSCERNLGPGVWLKGLGAKQGVLGNSCFNCAGRASVLLEASLDGTVIYKNKNAGVAEVPDTELSIRVDGLNVTVSGADCECLSLCSDNGMLVGNIRPKDGKVCITLPSKGIYILKAGDKSRKIMAM